MYSPDRFDIAELIECVLAALVLGTLVLCVCVCVCVTTFLWFSVVGATLIHMPGAYQETRLYTHDARCIADGSSGC